MNLRQNSLVLDIRQESNGWGRRQLQLTPLAPGQKEGEGVVGGDKRMCDPSFSALQKRCSHTNIIFLLLESLSIQDLFIQIFQKWLRREIVILSFLPANCLMNTCFLLCFIKVLETGEQNHRIIDWVGVSRFSGSAERRLGWTLIEKERLVTTLVLVSTQIYDANIRPGQWWEICIWGHQSSPGFPTFQTQCSLVLNSLVISSQLVLNVDEKQYKYPCLLLFIPGDVFKFRLVYHGTKKHHVLSPIFRVKNLIPSCWERLLPGRNISVKEVCVRLFHLLAAEPEDNEAYSTEISIDKWYTFLNSFQSTNSHFISFSKALNHL